MYTDKDLVLHFVQGDKQAFHAIVKRYQDKIFNIALGVLGNKSDADDIAQEVFLKFFCKPRAYKGASEFSTWMYRVTVNLCFDFLRKNKKRTHQQIDMHDEQHPDIGHAASDDLFNTMARQEESVQVQNVLADMDEKYRSALVLREADDMSYKQIAEVLEVSEDNVKVLLFRAREQFKRRFYGV